MTLANYLDGIMEKQREIGYRFPETLFPPATIAEIENAEVDVGFKFCDELKQLFLYANGSEYTNNRHLGLIPIHRLLTLDEAKRYFVDYVTNETMFDEAFENWETGERPGKCMFPFLADDSLHTYWLDLNIGSKNYGKVYDALMTGESPFYAYSSLITMLKVIYESYKENIFFLDENGWLEENTEEFVRVCKKYNSDISYWDKFIQKSNDPNVRK
jgi:hypothetical protein